VRLQEGEKTVGREITTHATATLLHQSVARDSIKGHNPSY